MLRALQMPTVDVSSVDGNSGVTSTEVSDEEHCLQVQRSVMNILNKQSPLGTGVVIQLVKG